jgi:hypothetical protein
MKHMQLLKRRTDQLASKHYFYLRQKHSQLSKRRVGLYQVLLRQGTLSNVAFLQKKSCFDDWLTVHCSITLVDLQLDTQNSYLFTYNTFIKILYMFRHFPAHLREVYVVTVYMQPLVSLLSADDCHLQTVTIPNF